eukprot:6480637-Amphidinium_carterae.1
MVRQVRAEAGASVVPLHVSRSVFKHHGALWNELTPAQRLSFETRSLGMQQAVMVERDASVRSLRAKLEEMTKRQISTKYFIMHQDINYDIHTEIRVSACRLGQAQKGELQASFVDTTLKAKEINRHFQERLAGQQLPAASTVVAMEQIRTLPLGGKLGDMPAWLKT